MVAQPLPAKGGRVALEAHFCRRPPRRVARSSLALAGNRSHTFGYLLPGRGEQLRTDSGLDDEKVAARERRAERFPEARLRVHANPRSTQGLSDGHIIPRLEVEVILRAGYRF